MPKEKGCSVLTDHCTIMKTSARESKMQQCFVGLGVSGLRCSPEVQPCCAKSMALRHWGYACSWTRWSFPGVPYRGMLAVLVIIAVDVPFFSTIIVCPFTEALLTVTMNNIVVMSIGLLYLF